ncbi:MAG: ATP:cob(I)alamin adenosyltransferase [Treponema sp.]|jgi:cob(I)alamin adenosyltransferase|nr:ATP:cob(I)alamin adenosyltransferase [Treponema sp.]
METSNLNGGKLLKNTLQIHLLGTLDELNAHLGLVKVKLPDEKNKNFLENIQKNLMKLMSHVSDVSNESYFFSDSKTAKLENEIDALKKLFPIEYNFILPGKNETEAFIHIARTTARKAERYYAAVSEQTPLCSHAADYLNKLSDYLFYLSFIPIA